MPKWIGVCCLLVGILALTWLAAPVWIALTHDRMAWDPWTTFLYQACGPTWFRVLGIVCSAVLATVLIVGIPWLWPNSPAPSGNQKNRGGKKHD